MTLLRLAKNIYFIYFLNTCFYNLNYLACKRGMKLISFGNETHFRKRKRYLIDGLLDFWCGEGGGFFCQLYDLFSSIKPVLNFFGGVIAQHPNRSVPKMLSGPTTFSWKNLDIYVLLALLLLLFFYITERISSDNFRK